MKSNDIKPCDSCAYGLFCEFGTKMAAANTVAELLKYYDIHVPPSIQLISADGTYPDMHITLECDIYEGK